MKVKALGSANMHLLREVALPKLRQAAKDYATAVSNLEGELTNVNRAELVHRYSDVSLAQWEVEQLTQ